MKRPRLLMCPPRHYGIHYEINPWMNRKVKADHKKAATQWGSLLGILRDDLDLEVEIMNPVKGLPDMVFTANAGFVEGNLFIPSRFRYAERRGEERHFRAWFEKRGYRIATLPGDGFFEGFGDAMPVGRDVFAGYRFRSDIQSHKALGDILERRVISLELVDPRFYHLDTCFCPLENGDVLYYPGAFDAYGLEAIEGNVEGSRLVKVSEKEALSFCCNAVVVGRKVVINTGAGEVVSRLEGRGLQVIQTDLSEFLKSGGSAKCLTLRLSSHKEAL